MSALDDALTRSLDSAPIVEFAAEADWFQIDPVGTRRWRWRHHRAPGWSGWSRCTRADLDEISRIADQSTVRFVPRAEADDWRSRPGFPCHKETTT